MDATSWILIDGEKLAITPSLALALVHLRPRVEPLRIWIDQICINQKDTEEKNEQVANMGKIYRAAQETLIWLGPAADGSNKLMNVFNRLGAFAEEFNLLGYYKKDRIGELQKIFTKSDPDDPNTIRYHTFCHSVLPLFTQSFYKSLIAFYRRLWFQRTWVLQEFSLGLETTFICGHKRIRAENLMVVMQMITVTITRDVIREHDRDHALADLIKITNELNTLQPFFSSRQRRKARDEGRIAGDGLYQILQRVHVDQMMQASEGCDMIYGLLGLVRDADSLGICADYRKTARETYTQTARALIQSGKIDLLALAQHPKKDIFLPSWVPDWQANLQRSFAWLRDEEKDPLFSASAGMKLELVDGEDERVLTLMGFRLDEVEEIGGPWTGGVAGTKSGLRFPHEAYITYLSQIRQMCQLSKAKGNDIYTSEERRSEAEWRIPVGDIEQDETADPLRATLSWKNAYEQCVAQVELQMQWKAIESVDAYKRRLKEVEDMGDQASSYRIRMQEMKNKRPFLSHLGYVGMGPTYMCPGDIIVVLTGASLPFIVRPVADGKFRFLGECYCDGIMDGEVVKVRTKEKIVLI
jgi:hypothetical protein